MLPLSFYSQDAVSLAQSLIGCELVHKSPGGLVSGIIVETEAYRQDDEASHSFRGKTPRNAVMFGPAGQAYTYFTYGMHYCLNVVAGEVGFAEAVLIRALAPTCGLDVMMTRRNTERLTNLCSGPAKLVQAMGILGSQNDTSLMQPELHILPRGSMPVIVQTSPRIGISRATHKLWRFFIPNNPYITQHTYNRLT